MFRRLALLLILLIPAVGAAQGWGFVEGQVDDSDGSGPLPGVSVVVAGTNFGSATNNDGWYSFRLPAGTWVLRFTYVGYTPVADTVVVYRARASRVDKALSPAVTRLEDITIEAQDAGDVGAYTLDPQAVQGMPGPFASAFAALKTLPGVATNNELSNQYSVRGGGFNENLIFIEGYEVYLPFRPRQGEQEGLGLLNPEMAGGITFYTGGFPVRYGGKLASALDVRYHKPDRQPLQTSVYTSLLDAGATAGASAFDGRFRWSAGVRNARGARFFGTQELKGNYEPDYRDGQAFLSYRPAEGHEISALGIAAEHAFKLDPSSRKTYFGTYSLGPGGSDLRSLWINYAPGSGEHDRYGTYFGGVRSANRLSSAFRMEHDASWFQTVETEEYMLAGSTVLYQVQPAGDDAIFIPTGVATQRDSADNSVTVDIGTLQGRYFIQKGSHLAEAGWSARSLKFEDQLFEEASVTARDQNNDPVRVVLEQREDRASLSAHQAAFYLQDVLDVLPTAGRMTLTMGVRTDWYSFNQEWTVSPRVSVNYRATEETTWLASWGIYHQAPSYRELRGEPTSGEVIETSLNRSIRSQRSNQAVVGVERFIPQRRLYLRAEAYAKRLTNLISYAVENVRVRYSGMNDSRGYAYGMDFQVRGEFVPGLESWANYSYLVAREEFLPQYRDAFKEGVLARPTDQRHTFSSFIQDYIPGDRSWRVHLRLLYGSGLPYTPPVPGRDIGGFVEQVPGARNSGRFESYKRVDMGLTRVIDVFDSERGRGLRLQLTAEVLNVFNMTNTVAYSWIPGSDGIWNRVPTRLTPRTINVRFRADF